MHYMFDLECLGHAHDCIVVSVGAVKFKLETGEILDQKYWELSLTEQKRKGRSIDVTTIQWWSQQPSEVLAALHGGAHRVTIEVFIREFNKFIEEKGYYWAKGTNYDLEILTNLYAQYGQQPPFKYSKWLDARVFYHLAKTLRIEPPRERIGAHNALADALYQTEVVCNIYKRLKK